MFIMIKIRHLNFSYPVKRDLLKTILDPFSSVRHIVLRDVSLNVKSGTIHSLIGLNGAGKTTLIKILAGVLLPKKNKVFIAGHDVAKYSNHTRPKIGIVTNNDRSFFYRLSGKQNLEFFGSLQDLYGDKLRRKMYSVLKLVNLYKFRNIRYDSYSQGMRQRLAIARSLLHDPDILLLDEPTLGIDIIGTKEIQNYILMLTRQYGKTVLLSTHDLKEAISLADEVSFIHKGKVINASGKLRDKNSLEKQYLDILKKETI